MSNLIRRQDAIDLIEQFYAFESKSEQIALQIAMRDLPSAQHEPKRGKWERHYCEDGNPDGWQCDKCKEWYYFGQTLPNFCPNCGAKMEVNHESN